MWLINSNVPEFSHGNRFNHEPKRARKKDWSASASTFLHVQEADPFHKQGVWMNESEEAEEEQKGTWDLEDGFEEEGMAREQRPLEEDPEEFEEEEFEEEEAPSRRRRSRRSR